MMSGAMPLRSQTYRRVLVALDGSDASQHALAWAREIARVHGSEVVVVTVATPPYVDGALGMGATGWQYAAAFDAERGRCEAILDEATMALRAEGLEAHGVLAVGGSAERIVETAERESAGLVVLGSRARGPVGRMLLGSVAERVRARASCSVLIARTEPRPNHVLAAIDGSLASRVAAATAGRLAVEWRSRLTVLHVMDRLGHGPVASPTAGIPAGIPQVTYAIGSGDAATGILRHAKAHGIGLIAMGSRGLGAMRGAMLGSVSNRVTHEAPCSVLLVREAAQEADG